MFVLFCINHWFCYFMNKPLRWPLDTKNGKDRKESTITRNDRPKGESNYGRLNGTMPIPDELKSADVPAATIKESF